MDMKDRLAALLTKNRPSRYTDTEQDWIEDSIDQLLAEEQDIDADRIVRDHLRALAKRAEGTATKSANGLLRHYGEHGCLPVAWRSFLSCPISIENEKIVDGKPVRVRERVKLAQATGRDFQLWAETEERQRNRDYKARGMAVSGASALGAEIPGAGFMSFFAWAEAVAPVEESEAAS